MNIAAGLVLVVAGQWLGWEASDRARNEASRLAALAEFHQMKAEQERIAAAVRKGEIGDNAIGLPYAGYKYQTVYQFDEGMGVPVVKKASGSMAVVEVVSRFGESQVILRNVDITKLKVGQPNPGLHNGKFVYKCDVKLDGKTYAAFEVSKKK